MARKTLAEARPEQAALEDFKALSLVNFEMAQDAYKRQDSETKTAIDQIVSVLKNYVTGHITVNGKQIEVDPETVKHNLVFLAVEMVKDLAMCNVRVASFKFPANICVRCGDEV